MDKKITGTWYDVVSSYDLINNDSVFKLISSDPEKLENYKYYPSTIYLVDKTFQSKVSDYKKNGTFAFKGDTLIKIGYDTVYEIIYRINKNVYVASNAKNTNKLYFYSVKGKKMEKVNRKYRRKNRKVIYPKN